MRISSAEWQYAYALFLLSNIPVTSNTQAERGLINEKTKSLSPTKIIICLLIIVGIILGIYYEIPAYRDYLRRTSYITQAWSYRYYYHIGYVAHAERTNPTEHQTADIYFAVVDRYIPKGKGVFLFVDSEHFEYTTDRPTVIISGKDGYEEDDFWSDAFDKKYRTKFQRSIHMTELPFHFQLNLIPIAELPTEKEGTVHVEYLVFGPDEDPSQMNQEELKAWVEIKRDGVPASIEIPYYFDGDYIYWGYSAIEEAKNS